MNRQLLVAFAAISIGGSFIGAKGCSESEQCQAARAAEAAVCPSAPDSASCQAARQAVAEMCRPEPTPTPTPEPTPTPTPLPTPTPVPTPTPTPTPPASCSIDGEPGPLIPDRRPELGAAVNEAMHALRPDCDPGGRCVLAEGRQAWQARVVAELRRRGVCAGQHEPDTDEIAAATSDKAPREGWHVYAGPWDGPGTVVWSPQAARPAYAAPVLPPPPTPPPGDACPAPPCPARLWTAETLPEGWSGDLIGKPRWHFNSHESGRLWADHTPVLDRDEPHCRAIGMSPRPDGTLRADCPVRPDGHSEREVVERWLLQGDPVPASRAGQDCDPEGRPKYAVPRGSGNCRLCEPGRVGDPSRVCGAWW